MNPKQSTNLDPNLREAYERIMSGNPATTPTTVPQPVTLQNQTPLTNQPSVPIAQNTSSSPGGSFSQSFSTTVQQPQTLSPIASPFKQTKMETESLPPAPPLVPQTNLNPMEQDITSSPLMKGGAFINPATSTKSQVVLDNQKPKKKHKFLSFILGVGTVIFIAIYGVIWAKVFGLF
jgi:hypothetical protein